MLDAVHAQRGDIAAALEAVSGTAWAAGLMPCSGHMSLAQALPFLPDTLQRC